MVVQNVVAEQPLAISGWSEALAELHSRIVHRFARSETKVRARRYLAGLLDPVERKNGWQLAEAIGEVGPQGVQRLLNNAKWDADLVRDDLREYVVEHLADEESGVFIVDETGFLKRGSKSVGVARQYTGTSGDTANAQVGVFLAYASENGAAFLDRALYLPEKWTEDPDRRAEARVPETMGFASKVVLAKRMLERAFKAGIPAKWVVADSFYGRSHGFRRWLEGKGRRPYVVMVPKTNTVRCAGRRTRIERLAEGLPEDGWGPSPTQEEVVPGGKRPWEWACLELSEDGRRKTRRWLLVRRSPDDPDDLAFYQAYGPGGTSVGALIRACEARWKVEDCFAEAKGEVGLDQYEVRRWDAWYRYVTLCLLAHAFLVGQAPGRQRGESGR